MLIVHQAVRIPHHGKYLLCPMQMWLNDVIVNEVSKFLTVVPKKKHISFKLVVQL